jgi:hypothetical protein
MIALLTEMSTTRAKEMRDYAATRRLAAKAQAGRPRARRRSLRRLPRRPALRHRTHPG